MNFADYVIAEQVRLLEGDEADESVSVKGDNFEQSLLDRALRLVDTQDWAATVAAPQKWYRRAVIALLLVFSLLGFAAVINALAGSDSVQSINIYWLLLVLLGFNTVSLLLWLLGCVGNIGGLIRGSVSSLPLSAQRIFTRAQRQQKQGAYSAWYQCMFAGKAGVWRLSTVSHAIWLAYLIAGFLSLLLLFSVRQYDFVWGTTLLSGDAFITLTHWLARPLQIFGIAVPDAQQVMASRSGSTSGSESGMAFRRHWAVFLLGAVTLYGILPRLLCYFVSRFFLRRMEASFRPDYYLPYYVDLRHQLLPESGAAEIIDADPTAPVERSQAPAPDLTKLQLPAQYTLLGFELYPLVSGIVEINVLDRQTQAAAEKLLETKQKMAVAIAVEANAAPDRGSERKLKRLFGNNKQRWLLLHCSGDNANQNVSEQKDQRLADWYRIAQAGGVPVEHIQAVSTDELQALKSHD